MIKRFDITVHFQVTAETKNEAIEKVEKELNHDDLFFGQVQITDCDEIVNEEPEPPSAK